MRHEYAPDVIKAARQVEAGLVDVKSGISFVTPREGKLIYGINGQELPQPLQQIFDSREAMLRRVVAQRDGMPESSFDVERAMLTRLAVGGFHRDPESGIYIETILGRGTRIATGFGEAVGILANVLHVELDAGEGVLFNIKGQARHSSPSADDIRPRLGFAMFLTYQADPA
jgi:hypothetical protein